MIDTHKKVTIIWREDPTPLNNHTDAEVFALFTLCATEHGLLDAKVDVETLDAAVSA